MRSGLTRFFIILFGLIILIYPSLSEYMSERNSSRATSSYDSSVLEMERERIRQMLEDARAYNRQLYTMLQGSGTIPPEEERLVTPEHYRELLNVYHNDMMGYVRIPRLDDAFPIYHGTEEEVLQVGIGHVATTSLPVGGESTHTALSGHRGLPSSSLFTDLDQMEIGDVFYIHVLGEVLAYEVDQILTVLPEETEALAIEEGKDYATLITCTPYGINSHRLLVRGSRIDYAADKMTSQETTALWTTLWKRLPAQYRHLWVGLTVLLILPIIRFLVRYLIDRWY